MAVGSHACSGNTYRPANTHLAQKYYMSGGWHVAAGIHICWPTQSAWNIKGCWLTHSADTYMLAKCIQCKNIKITVDHTLQRNTYMSPTRF